MKKQFVTALLVLALLSLSAMPVLAHSGGLDRNGGHWDHSTGTYHYHRP